MSLEKTAFWAGCDLFSLCIHGIGLKCPEGPLNVCGDAFGFVQDGRHDFWVTKGKVGTPAHVAFHAADRSAVDAFYTAAMDAGAKDNGKPGMRDDYGYAAFVLDPDGHNVEAVIWKEELRRPEARKAPARSRRTRRKS